MEEHKNDFKQMLMFFYPSLTNLLNGEHVSVVFIACFWFSSVAKNQINACLITMKICKEHILTSIYSIP